MEYFYEGHFIHGLMLTYFRVNSNINTEVVRATTLEF